jgi:hypothetical protein
LNSLKDLGESFLGIKIIRVLVNPLGTGNPAKNSLIAKWTSEKN